MKLSIRGLALAGGIVWGLACLLCAIANALWPPYAQDFLTMVASFYPGYDAQPVPAQIVLVGAYAFVDGLIAGALIAWLHNLLRGRKSR